MFITEILTNIPKLNVITAKEHFKTIQKMQNYLKTFQNIKITRGVTAITNYANMILQRKTKRCRRVLTESQECVR